MFETISDERTKRLMEAAFAAPKTHEVVTTYSCGKVRRFQTRSLASAENHAISERRSMGRDLIDRETGAIARKVSVEIKAVA